MNGIQRRDSIPSTSRLARFGVTAVGYTAAGIFLFVLQAIASFRVLGLIAGAVVCIIGFASLKSRDPADKRAGAIITAAGVLTVLSMTGIPFFARVSGTLLSIGAVGLLALGIWNGIKFFIGLKKRS
jgi:hypothetical protein